MYSEPNRAFNYAVLASIVLHGMLLFGFSLRERARPAEPQVPILARLIEPPAAAPTQAEPVKPRPRPKPAAPKPVAREAPAPERETPAEAPAEEQAVTQMQSESVAPAPVEPQVIARADPAPAAGVPPEPVADPGSLEQYRHQLVLAAPRYKRYPRMASDNNWAGLVALRMVVAPSGRVALTITKTSGHDVLDKQALEMFRNAAAVVPVPPVLRGKEFAVDVAADYYFRD
jgi:periplasmic protein TonB